jgi:hypothetical protein
MAMTREEQDAFDRKMAGINTPGAYGEGMAALDRAVGNPIASYSLDDLRRMFLRGSAVPAATPGAMPAETEAMAPPLPTDAMRGPALPGPVTAVPLPPPAPPAAVPTGTRPSAPVMPPPPAPPAAYRMDPRAAAELTAAAAPMAPTMAPMQAEPPPGEASTAGARLTPQQMAAALRRFGRMELDPNSFAARFARTQR